MTRLGKQTDPVRPSVPDPVDAWLDVLVTMLAIPRADRQTVRDELEDHLRSRIDDLLIHGLSEPQALEKAVAELGETADLARQLSHAHKPPRTRRYAMHALIIALAGTVVALGVNQVRPNAGLPAVVAAESDAVVERDATSPVTNLDQITISVPVGGELTILDHLNRYADASGLALEIDRAALGSFATDWHEQSIFYTESHRGSVTLAETLDSMMNRADYGLWATGGGKGRFVAVALDGKLVVTTALGLDLRTTERRVYPLARFAENAPDPVQGTHAQVMYDRLMQAVSQHVSPMDWQDNGGDLATATVLGSSLIVTAPTRIHEQIDALLDDLNAQSIEQAEQRHLAEAARRDAAARHHSQLVVWIKGEYERALSEQAGLTERIQKLSASVSRLQVSLGNLPAEDREEAIKPIYQELAGIDAEMRSVNVRLLEATARVDYLRSRMIEIEYEQLFSDLPFSHQPPATLTTKAMRIEGAVVRPGDYEIPPTGMTLKRFITVAGGYATDRDSRAGRIQLHRDGELIVSVRPEDLSGEDGQIELRAGDRVTVAATPSRATTKAE